MLSARLQLYLCTCETLAKLKLSLTPEELVTFFFFVITLFFSFTFGS